MNRNILHLILVLLQLSLCMNASYAQSRQSDSSKNKQLAYNRYMKEMAEKKAHAEQLALAKKNSNVVMYDSKGNKIVLKNVWVSWIRDGKNRSFK